MTPESFGTFEKRAPGLPHLLEIGTISIFLVESFIHVSHLLEEISSVFFLAPCTGLQSQ